MFSALRVREKKEVYEGEVTELTPCETENPLGGKIFYVSPHRLLISCILGYGKALSHVIVGMKTAKGTKQLKLDPTIYDNILKQKVEVGDVIYIEANTGSLKVSFNVS